MSFGEFMTLVYEKLGLDPVDKVIHFTVKYDYKQLILMKDDSYFHTFKNFNDDFGHVYISNAAAMTHIHHGNMLSNDVVSNAGGSCKTLKDILVLHDQVPQNAASVWNDIIIGPGQVFQNAESFRIITYKFSIVHRFSYRFTHNKPGYLKVVCEVDGCPWKISAMKVGNIDQVFIRKFNNLHKHSVKDLVKFKPKYNLKLMGDIFLDKVHSTPSYLPRQICKDSWSDYHFEMSYQQAWKVKEQAKVFLDGNVEDSYKLIPWYCNSLKELMSDTIATWSCHEDGTFKQLFVSHGCSIRGFHAGCRPLVFIDGCHLSGLYRVTLLAASSLDANNGMYPLAYGVVILENDEDWFWFLKHLKGVVGSGDYI